MGETEALAEYIAKARYEDLPQDVINHAKKAISDTIACGLGGRKTLEGDILIGIMKEMGGKPEATVIGDKARLSFMQAAQVNRVLTHVLDYDETYSRLGHMSTVLVPVALAIAERINASGKDILNAIVLGYEVIIRLRNAVDPSEEVYWKRFEKADSGVHLGVPVVAGKLLGLNAGEIADAFGLTGIVRPRRVTLPDRSKKGMPRWMKITLGDITIPGIHATLLAQRGFPGDRTLLDQGKGYEVHVGSDRYDASKLITNLGREYHTLGIAFKLHAACRLSSGALEAVWTIISEHGIKADDVEEVIVRGQKHLVNNFAIYEPDHMIQAQFSVPYVVTMMLVGEPTGPNWYTEEMLRDKRIRQLQHRVKIEEEPHATKEFYTERKVPVTVEVHTKDGRRFRGHVEYPKGEPENPFTEKDHIDKLTNMALYLGMKQGQLHELIEVLNRVEELDNVSELTRLLVP